jgi:hypothetical protein
MAEAITEQLNGAATRPVDLHANLREALYALDNMSQANQDAPSYPHGDVPYDASCFVRQLSIVQGAFGAAYPKAEDLSSIKFMIGTAGRYGDVPANFTPGESGMARIYAEVAEKGGNPALDLPACAAPGETLPPATMPICGAKH